VAKGGNTALHMTTIPSQAQPGDSLDPGLTLANSLGRQEPTQESPVCHCRRFWVANPQVQPLAAFGIPYSPWRVMNTLALVHWHCLAAQLS